MNAVVRDFDESGVATAFTIRLVGCTNGDARLVIAGGSAVSLQAGHSTAVQHERGHRHHQEAGDQTTKERPHSV